MKLEWKKINKKSEVIDKNSSSREQGQEIFRWPQGVAGVKILPLKLDSHGNSEEQGDKWIRV